MSKKRPSIPSIKETASSEEERFQNKTLRPIIKMQHDLLIAFFRQYCSSTKIVLHDLSNQQKTALISRVIKKDIAFRNELKGLIIGHFSVEEYHAYLNVQRGLNKRIFTIVEQRLGDSLEAL